MFGVYEEDADADLISCTKTSAHDVLKKGLPNPTALVLCIDGETCEQNGRNRSTRWLSLERSRCRGWWFDLSSRQRVVPNDAGHLVRRYENASATGGDSRQRVFC